MQSLRRRVRINKFRVHKDTLEYTWVHLKIFKDIQMKKWLLFLSIMMVMTGCSNRPKDIIDEEKMVEIMADLQIVEAYERNGKAPDNINGSNRELLGRGVLMSHGVTVEEMDSTLAWYGRNMDEYAKLYKKVDERLNKMQLKYARAAGETENGGPSTDLWPYGRHLVLDRNQMTDGIVVSIPVPDITSGDKLTWKMRTHGLNSRRMILGVDYDDGRSEIVDNSNNGMEPWMETSLQTDTLRTVSRIFAILNADHANQRAFIDSIQLLYYPFNIEEYHRSGYQRKIGAPARKIIELANDTVKSEEADTTAVAKPVKTAKTDIKPVARPSKKDNIKPIKAVPSRSK